MKINFDYYTSSAALAAEAFTLADECGAAEISIRKSDWGDNPFNIDGKIDFNQMPKLMEFFEANGFTDQN